MKNYGFKIKIYVFHLFFRFFFFAIFWTITVETSWVSTIVSFLVRLFFVSLSLYPNSLYKVNLFCFSNLSGTSLLGIPTEVYFYGSQYSACVITAILAGLITVFIFLPVFYKLQLTSIFEYLELRFARSVRILSSLLFVIMLFVYVPVVIYAPALVFTQVTDINLHMITPLLCISCIIYTTIVSSAWRIIGSTRAINGQLLR